MSTDFSALTAQFPQVKWQTQVELKTLTTMRVGGPAAIVGRVKKEKLLIEICRFCHGQGWKYRVVGGLSNLVALDEGYDGVLLLNQTQELTRQDADSPGKIYAGSGWRMAALVNQLIDWGQGGLESFLSLPGTLGGAIYNNAHFKEESISQAIETIKVYQPEIDEVVELTPDQAEMNYDQTIFHRRPEWLILGATLSLYEISPVLGREKAKAAAAWRLERQPLNCASSGCIFQNVPNNPQLQQLFPEFADRELISTGFLIDQAGLKGQRQGDLEISPKHAAFIVNHGQGTSQDLTALINLIKETLTQKFGVTPVEEVFYLV